MPGREPPVSFLISAEHAGNRVPAPWQALFAGHQSVLDSHRGWDPGSGELARALAAALDAPLLESRFTRLLVDLNRSAGHPRHLSEFTRGLPPAEKRELIERYWQPHWDCYGEYLESLPGRIIHIACHSFSPEMNGKTRGTDIGLLYDPSRSLEARYCRALGAALRSALPEFTIHMNQPYLGISNGMGQQHRRRHPDRRLITLELEMNQRLVDQVGRLGDAIVPAVRTAAAAIGQ